MSLWTLIYYGWFVFMVAAIGSVIGAAVWESTAPKRRLKQAAQERANREQEAALAAAATESTATPATEEQVVAEAAESPQPTESAEERPQSSQP